MADTIPSFITHPLALLIEAVFGYPDALYARIGHPVTWIGSLISRLDRALNRETWTLGQRKAAGVAALALLLAAVVLPAALLQRFLAPHPLGLAVLAILASTLLATRSLDSHVRAVAMALSSGGLEAGRAAVSQIVGRDPEALDAAGVSRAAIESLAENFSDGVVAPALWLALLGLPGIAAYKAINTADSMVGHRTPRHEAFGWAAARLDDLVNLPASRLTAVLITAASCLAPGAAPRQAWKAVLRDAPRHRSPNAGWPEAAMAGALGLQLAGPRSYGGVMTPGTPMGDGRTGARADDIFRALRLYRIAVAIGWGLAALAALLALAA